VRIEESLDTYGKSFWVDSKGWLQNIVVSWGNGAKEEVKSEGGEKTMIRRGLKGDTAAYVEKQQSGHHLSEKLEKGLK